ncbi:helix-turn-helix domain-containing protein [Lentzea aerocolonigenes]|uniref:helix-turn-helix domain-containing protein n=1 Tax=Lentzea aerocolonigenes TaxID=68170 RepID=UPI00068C09C5|nr:helix-turn-helix transcriptional regulator [Lentzea aerocolonigenes]MCP2243330.1 Helix-turn-helix domain-containing protein [Lentzea aerocolonigenes]
MGAGEADVAQRHDLVNLRKAAGFTQESLAAEVGADRSAVWRWESGRSVPEPLTQPRLARALGVTNRELAAVLTRSDAADEVPAALAHGISVPPAHPTAGLIDVLGPSQTLATASTYTKGIIARYEQEGPQRLAPELSSLRRLSQQLGARVSTDADRTALTRLSAQQAALLAYMSVNLSKFSDAEDFALEAALLATALNDNAMLAWVRGTQSFAAYYRKRYKEALDLAEAGVELAGQGRQRIRLLSNGVARAAGKLGDRKTVQRALGDAFDTVERADGPVGMTSCIDLEPYGWARTAANAATACLAIGDYAQVLKLTKELEPVVEASDSDWSRSLIKLDEATALTMPARADLEHAAVVGMEALEFSASKPIASVAMRAKELAGSLRQRGSAQTGSTLLEAVCEWQKPMKAVGR